MVEYYCVDEIKGPILIIRGKFKPKLGEMVKLHLEKGVVHAQVLETSKDVIILQSFDTLEGVSKSEISVEYSGELFKFPIGDDLQGRILNGYGEPIDDGPLLTGEDRDISGSIIRPSSRAIPRGIIETGVSSIDLLNTLINGQKLPIFSGAGLSHLKLIGEILKNISKEDYMVVFGGLGLAFDEYNYMMTLLEKSGILKNSVFFLNRTTDPVVERIILPRVALTAAEYFAFEKSKKVVTILYDITNYADALREISSMRGEFPGRMGYPPYLYTDLASMFERSGMIKGREGSLTQMPVLTMPNDDMTHPVPDLTGYITEGQLILSRDLDKEGVFPPINIIPSLSRLMHHGSKGIVREDFNFVGDMVYSAYAKYLTAKKLQLISGTEALSESDRKYLEFGEMFKEKFLHQKGRRSMNDSLDIAWECVEYLPDFEISKIPKKFEKYRQ